MPSQWDHKADKDLLLAIIDEGFHKSIVWPAIAEKMKAKEYTFTPEACRQHFQKIRKESKFGKSTNPSTPNGKGTSTPGSKRPKSGSKASSFATSNGTSSFNINGNDDDDDEEAFDETPIKKQKVVKKEEGQENGYGMRGAKLFKVEDLTEGGETEAIDLEHDDIYEG